MEPEEHLNTTASLSEHNQSEHPGPNVAVTVDNQAKQVHRGSHLVLEFKTLVGVDASRALDELIAGQFKPLDDTQRITLKGGELFISHVRQGGSS